MATTTEELWVAAYIEMKHPVIEHPSYTDAKGRVHTIWNFESGAEGRKLDLLLGKTDEARIIKAYLDAKERCLQKHRENVSK